MEFLQITLSPVTKAKPKLRIGPISGEISIAPMMTGELFISKPQRAMRLATFRTKKYPTEISPSAKTPAMTAL